MCVTEREQLRELTYKNKHFFPIVATRTNKIFHDIHDWVAIPVKQFPYQMNPFQKEYHQKWYILVMPFGMKKSTAKLQRLVNMVLMV